MGINITQFAPPGTVSKLVWDDDMEAGAGKIFKGDLTGNVTGNVTGDVVGNITNGGVNGYLLRSGVVSASSGTLIVPAGSSNGNTTRTITLNGNGTYCIVGNTYKCFYPNPFVIPVVMSGLLGGRGVSPGTSYAKSYDSDGVLIDEVIFSQLITSGSLNIYDASYIVINGGVDTYTNALVVSISDTYIDADTTIIPGMIAPPTNGVFTGDVIGNVTGKINYTWTMTPIGGTTDLMVGAKSEREFYNISPNGTITGTIRMKKDVGAIGGVYLIGIDEKWDRTFIQELTTDYTTYTIAPNTTSLYVRNNSNVCLRVDFNKFTLT